MNKLVILIIIFLFFTLKTKESFSEKQEHPELKNIYGKPLINCNFRIQVILLDHGIMMVIVQKKEEVFIKYALMLLIKAKILLEIQVKNLMLPIGH